MAENLSDDTGGESASKTRLTTKTQALLTERTTNLLKSSPRIRMLSAAQITALNETLLLLLVAFGDWEMRLALLALILIRKRHKT